MAAATLDRAEQSKSRALASRERYAAGGLTCSTVKGERDTAAGSRAVSVSTGWRPTGTSIQRW